MLRQMHPQLPEHFHRAWSRRTAFEAWGDERHKALKRSEKISKALLSLSGTEACRLRSAEAKAKLAAPCVASQAQKLAWMLQGWSTAEADRPRRRR